MTKQTAMQMIVVLFYKSGQTNHSREQVDVCLSARCAGFIMA